MTSHIQNVGGGASEQSKTPKKKKTKAETVPLT